MSGSVVHQESRSGWKPQAEMEWQAWVEKGRERERRSSAARLKVVKWVSIAVLLGTAALWSQLTPYEVVVRFIVAGGALVVMFQAFHAKQYAFAAVFGVLALLYNPLAPTFSLSGDWQRVLVVASAVPFVASIVWGNVKVAHSV